MDPNAIPEILDRAEHLAASGESLAGAGFWRVVDLVKRDPELVERHADRIARIDRMAFEPWPLIKVPIVPGTIIALVVTIAGLALIGAAYYVGGSVALVLFSAGFVALLATTHGLGHLAVGAAVGIRFTHWFIGSLLRPQPGVKIDYSTYLRAPATARAWMHAAGAVMTKLVPFALIGAAAAAELAVWFVWALAIAGIGTVITDIMWSTKSSDWKKFRREMRLVQS